ncbi:hypothetical protein [Streptomyces nigrescens]|uniref:hypothetical protein n=1 Tax=Streptomyces nigrescens TaxID=1920 RepID=UPI003482D7CF
MTKGHEHVPPAAALPGLRVERTADRPVHLTQAGRIAVPLTVTCGGTAVEIASLVLTAEQTEEFYRELGGVLHPRPSTEAAS